MTTSIRFSIKTLNSSKNAIYYEEKTNVTEKKWRKLKNFSLKPFENVKNLEINNLNLLNKWNNYSINSMKTKKNLKINNKNYPTSKYNSFLQHSNPPPSPPYSKESIDEMVNNVDESTRLPVLNNKKYSSPYPQHRV